MLDLTPEVLQEESKRAVERRLQHILPMEWKFIKTWQNRRVPTHSGRSERPCKFGRTTLQTKKN